MDEGGEGRRREGGIVGVPRSGVKALVALVVIAVVILAYRTAWPTAPFWVDLGLIAGGIAWLIARSSRR
jgi:hypothetical protein